MIYHIRRAKCIIASNYSSVNSNNDDGDDENDGDDKGK